METDAGVHNTTDRLAPPLLQQAQSSSHFQPQYSGRPDESGLSYVLEVRQQPKQARMCGAGEKADRRPIDPAPVVRLRIIGPEHTDVHSLIQSPHYFCYTSLYMHDRDEELYLLPGTRTRHLTGSIVSSLYYLRDPHTDSYAAYFIFPDIGVRVEGDFRFKMTMYEIVENKVRFCQSVFTESFRVYSAKRFPGMDGSTELSKSFADQGIRIRIRRPVHSRRSINRGSQRSNRSIDESARNETNYSDRPSQRAADDRHRHPSERHSISDSDHINGNDTSAGPPRKRLSQPTLTLSTAPPIDRDHLDSHGETYSTYPDSNAQRTFYQLNPPMYSAPPRWSPMSYSPQYPPPQGAAPLHYASGPPTGTLLPPHSNTKYSSSGSPPSGGLPPPHSLITPSHQHRPPQSYTQSSSSMLPPIKYQDSASTPSTSPASQPRLPSSNHLYPPLSGPTRHSSHTYGSTPTSTTTNATSPSIYTTSPAGQNRHYSSHTSSSRYASRHSYPYVQHPAHTSSHHPDRENSPLGIGELVDREMPTEKEGVKCEDDEQEVETGKENHDRKRRRNDGQHEDSNMRSTSDDNEEPSDQEQEPSNIRLCDSPKNEEEANDTATSNSTATTATTTTKATSATVATTDANEQQQQNDGNCDVDMKEDDPPRTARPPTGLSSLLNDG